MKHAIFIEPSYQDFLEDRLFELGNKKLNRDGTLLPFVRLREHCAAQGISVHTADKLRDGSERRDVNHYWSLGLMQGYEKFIDAPDVRLRGFILMEPPLIKPEMYKALPELTTIFEEVYVHNTVGACYSLNHVSRERLRPFFWPQPFDDIQPQYWNRIDRKNKLVAIAGNHNPRFRKPELYSERIKAIAELSERKGIDLYGRGWEKWWSRQSLWWAYWRYRRAISINYRGGCDSKWNTLSEYRFSLCFENMPMDGYITEKIFDCFYAGTIPIYRGASNIKTIIPDGAYIDMRNFNTYDEMLDYVQSMSHDQWQSMREVARHFLQTQGRELYYNSLINILRV